MTKEESSRRGSAKELQVRRGGRDKESRRHGTKVIPPDG